MRTTPLHWYLVAVFGILATVPVTVTAQHLALPTRSAARAGLSATPVTDAAPGDQLAAQVDRWQGAEQAAAATDGGQWVKGGLIGAAILGVATYAVTNEFRSGSDSPWSRGEVVGASAVMASLGFVIGSLIGSGFEK